MPKRYIYFLGQLFKVHFICMHRKSQVDLICMDERMYADIIIIVFINCCFKVSFFMLQNLSEGNFKKSSHNTLGIISLNI